MPVIGFVNVGSPQSFSRQLSAFLRGLSEAGYVDGRNVTIEYRWAEGRSDLLPAMVADLVQRQVSVIVANTPGTRRLYGLACESIANAVLLASGGVPQTRWSVRCEGFLSHYGVAKLDNSTLVATVTELKHKLDANTH